MIEVGRVCVKIAGRDAGKKCVIVSLLDNKFVLVDGETRRRKCNIIHLEPLDKVIDVKENAVHDDVVKAFKSFGVALASTKKSKKAVARPRTLRRSKLAQKPAPEKTAVNPIVKKSAENVVDAEVVKEEKTTRTVKKAKPVEKEKK